MDEYEESYLRFSNELSLIVAKEKIYNKLAILESNGLKDSSDFLKELRVLELIDEVLRDKMKNTKYSLLDLIYACTHIHNELLDLSSRDEESIMYRLDDLHYRYLLNILFIKTIARLEKDKNLNSITELSILRYKKKITIDQIDFDRYLNEDINRIYLTLLEDSIENCVESDLKKELIEAKYKLIFLSENLEMEMIARNFDVDKVIPIKSDFFCRFINVSSKNANEMFNNTIRNNIKNNKEYILEYLDDELESNKLELNLRGCYMRANLFLVSEDNLLRDNIEYYEEVAKRTVFDGYTQGDMIITDVYSNALKDKGKYKTLIIK